MMLKHWTELPFNCRGNIVYDGMSFIVLRKFVSKAESHSEYALAYSTNLGRAFFRSR